MEFTKLMRLAGLLVACVAAATPAIAEYPERPIMWVVGYPAGGGSDFVARTIAAHMATSMGTPVLIDNRPGASGNIAATTVVRAAADGYTVMTADAGTLVYSKALFTKLAFDPDKDLVPVSLMVDTPLILAVTSGLPANTVQEFLAIAKAKPGKIDFASPGAGSPHHLVMEALKQKTGIYVTHIPYRGAAPAVTDLISGLVQAMIIDLPSAQQFFKAGQLKPLAVLSPTRLKALPDTPTIAEAGVPGFSAAAWMGLAVPASTPQAVVTRLNAELKKALDDPAVSQRLLDAGLIPTASTPEALKQRVEAESRVWRPLIATTGISLD